MVNSGRPSSAFRRSTHQNLRPWESGRWGFERSHWCTKRSLTFCESTPPRARRHWPTVLSRLKSGIRPRNRRITPSGSSMRALMYENSPSAPGYIQDLRAGHSAMHRTCVVPALRFPWWSSHGYPGSMHLYDLVDGKPGVQRIRGGGHRPHGFGVWGATRFREHAAESRGRPGFYYRRPGGDRGDAIFHGLVDPDRVVDRRWLLDGRLRRSGYSGGGIQPDRRVGESDSGRLLREVARR